MSNKQNDFIAAILYQPEASLEDLYMHGITPDNTGIKEKDEYKNIKAIQEAFVDKDGNFDDKTFNEFYDSALRVFNEYQNNDFSEKAVDLIETSPLDWTNPTGKKYDTDAIVHLTNLPNKYTMGLGNVWEIGTPTFSDAEIAQSKKVLDENGNELDYTPNDKRGGFFKGVLRKPMALAIWEEDGTHLESGVEVYHKKGDLKLDEDGDARYQLLGNKSAAGRQLLRYWDTITVEGRWANKYDFMDSDGLRKSVGGVVAKTAFQIAPYFIPYVGSVYKYLMAAKELGTAMPMFLQSMNTAFGGSEDSEFGQSINSWSNRMNTFKPGMSQYGQSNFFSFENIGNIIATSVGQLYQQRAIGNIPKLLKQTGKTASKIGRQSALAYMALTSGQDAYNSFKEAGASDQVAGWGALGSMGALYGLMNIGYFEKWLFKGTWLDENRVLNETLKQTIDEKKKVWGFVKESSKTMPPATAREVFNTVKDVVGETWNKVFTVAGTSGRTISEVLGRSFNEGVEETMEELSTDFVKGLFLGLEGLGVNMTGTEDSLDFGFSSKDFATRYGGAFVGGAIGGAIFESVDRLEHAVKGGERLIDLDTRNRLLWFLRNGYGKQIRSEIERLYKKGKLGNKNLSATKSVDLEDVLNSGDGNIVSAFQQGSETDNQNLMVYRAMMQEIDALEHFLNSNRFMYSDSDLLAKMMKIATDKEVREGAEKNLENPLISKIVELGLADAVTNDVQLLLSKLDEKGIEIAKKRRELSNSIPDSTNKEDDINSNQELANLQAEYDEIKTVIDEILAGEHADYYVEYGLMLADKEMSKYFTPGDNSIAYSEIANYYWLNTGKDYSSLSEEEKNKVKSEYDAFRSLSGYSAQRQRFELFRNVNERYSDIITKSAEELKNAKYDPEFSPDIYGDITEKINKLNTNKREIETALETETDQAKIDNLNNRLNSIENDLAIFEALSKNASLERVRILPNSLPSMQKYAKELEELNKLQNELAKANEKMANLGDNPDPTILEDIAKEIEYATTQISLSQEYLNQIREGVILELTGNYSVRAENQVLKFDNDVLLKEAIPFLINTKLTQQELNNNVLHNGDISHTSNDYTTFLTNVISDPLGFDNYYQDLINKLVRESEEFGVTESQVKETVSKMLNGLDIELANIINEIKSYKERLPKTPLNDLIQNLHVEIAGRPLEILEMLKMEKERYLAAKQVDEYVLSHGDQQSKEIDNALRLLNLITATVDAASNGYNLEANKFRTGDKKIKLAEIGDNVTEIYKNEIFTLKQRLQYLKDLSSKNNAAQAKKQFDIMLNVEPKLIKSILDRKDEIQKELGINIEKIWNEVAGDVVLGNLTLETHPKFKDVKIEFETRIFKEVNGKFKPKDLANATFNIFKSDSTLWSCKAGEFNNTMDSFSPYVEMMYLLSFTTSNTYDFSCKWNENVLNDKFYSTKYTPFYSQEFTVRSVWAQMKNKDVYNELLKLLKTQVPKDLDDSTYLADLFTAENIIFVTGGPGTGKSSAVGLAIKLLAEAEQGKVIGMAKFGQQVDGLKDNLRINESESILFNDFEKLIIEKPTDLYDNSGTKGHASKLSEGVDLSTELEVFDKVNGPKVMVVDEFTFFTEGEIQLLSNYAKKHNILVVSLGDPKQNQITVNRSQTGFEDTIMFMTPALTISMRVSNAAKELNNTKLDTILSKCIDYYKDNREKGLKALNEGMKSEGMIPNKFEFVYSDDSDGFFGDIYQTFTNETKLNTVKNWVQKLKSSGKTVALITDDDSFNSLESVVDKIIDPFNVQGAEYDYVIVAKQNWDTLKLGNENNAFLFLRDLLTMSSRAKIGSVILADEKQTPFKNLVSITSTSSPAGKVIVNSETDSRFTALKEKYNEYIKGIYAKYVSEVETTDEEASDDSESGDAGAGDEYIPPGVEPTSEPPAEDVTLETVLNAYNTPLSEETSKYIRRSDYEKYNDRMAELQNGAFAHADTDKYVQYLYDGTIDLSKQGSLLRLLDPQQKRDFDEDFINKYRKYLQIISSIILYRPKDVELTKALEIANENLDSYDVITNDYINKIETAIRDIDNIGYFYIAELSPNENILYYVTEDFYIPINIVDTLTPGLYKNLKFSESSGVIGLSSNGTLHQNLDETVSSNVFRSNEGGVFSPDENTSIALKTENEDFKLTNIGKAAVYVTYKPWLQPENIFRFNVVNGVRDYTIQHQHEVKLIDIQKRIDFQTFINLCKHRQFVLRGTSSLDPNSEASSDKELDIDKSINILSEFLNISDSDINALKNKPAIDDQEAYKNWAKTAYSSTEILTPQTLNHLISVITSYYLLQNNSDSDQVLSNILKYIKSIGGYRSNTNYNQYNTKGFSIRLYKNSADKPAHSLYDDFFFEHLGNNEYVVYKNSWDEDIRDYEYIEMGKFSLQLDEDKPLDFFVDVLRTIKGTYDNITSNSPRIIQYNQEIDLETFNQYLGNNDFSIILGTKCDTYDHDLIKGETPTGDKISTTVWSMIDFGVISELLTGINLSDTTDLENYFKANSMLKNNLYVSMKGGEYYGMENGRNQFNISAHKRLPITEGSTSDYVRFIAPLFRIYNPDPVLDDSEVSKYSYLNTNKINEEKPKQETPVLYNSSSFKIIGDKNSIKVDNGSTVMLATVIGLSDKEMWIDSSLFKIPVRIPGDWINKVPKPLLKGDYQFKFGDMYFFKIREGMFLSFDTSSNTEGKWITLNGGLFDINNGTFITSEDVPGISTYSRFGIHVSDNLKIDQNGNIVDGEISFDKNLFNILFGKSDKLIDLPNNINVTKIDFVHNQLILNINSDIIERFVITEGINDMRTFFGLSDINFVQTNVTSESELFKKKLLDKISKNNNLKSLQSDIESLLSDDINYSLDLINTLLDEKILDLGAEYTITWDRKAIKITKKDTHASVVANLLKQKNISFDNIVITNRDDDNIETCNFIEFSLSLSDGSTQTGFLNKENNNWKLNRQIEPENVFTNIESLIFETLNPEADSFLISQLMQIVNEIKETGASDTYNEFGKNLYSDSRLETILDAIDELLMSNNDCNII